MLHSVLTLVHRRQYAVLLSSAPGLGLGSGGLSVQIIVLSCLHVMVNRIFRQLVS